MKTTQRPEPLLSRAVLTALAALVVGLLAKFGVQVDESTENTVLLVLVGLAPIVTAYLARGKVTALVDPQDDYGSPLFPYDPDAGTFDDYQPEHESKQPELYDDPSA